ncbi:EamA family transporter [Mesorhizobium caraganae]|uniref:EamA family transporter n=1 Tax=Mesorhizobium caraganae TaxID=483206 RepID=A0ABV1Z324_9HYPH
MTRRGLLLFALLSLLWGIPYLLIKLAVAEVSVPFLVFARTAVGALVLLPFALAQGSFEWLKTQWLAVAAFCVVEMVLPWGLITHGEVSIDSSTAGLLIAMTPAVTVALSKLMGSDERLGIRRWLGLFLGFAGVFVLALPTLGGGLLAVIEILIAAACYALGSIIASRWLNDVPASALTAVCLIGAAVIYAVPASQAWPTVMPSMTAVGAIVGLGVFCTAIAFATYFLLVREIGPERAVVITYVAPAVSVAAGVLVLSEPLDISILAAFALILCGSYLGTWRAAQEPSVSASTAS